MDVFTFDVFTSDHDSVKRGDLVEVWSRVHVSRSAFPVLAEASEVAGCLAVAVHGGMPTAILPRY